MFQTKVTHQITCLKNIFPCKCLPFPFLIAFKEEKFLTNEVQLIIFFSFMVFLMFSIFFQMFLQGFLLFFFFFSGGVVVVVCFLGPHLQHMEVPRLEVQSELQPLAYATAIATLGDRSCICDLHHSLWQCQIL